MSMSCSISYVQLADHWQASQPQLQSTMVGRVLIVILLLLLPAIASAHVSVDTLIDMDNVSPSSPGTQITATILSNGTVGSWGGWNNIVGTANSLSVGSHNPVCSLGTSISVGSTTYTPASPSQSISLNNASSFTYMVGTIPGGPSKVSVGGCITFGGVPGTSNLMDMLRINGSNGGYVVLQLKNGSCINIETDGNGTQHSGCIVPSGSSPTYWCTMLVDPTNSVAKLNCYQPDYPYAQVGGTVSVVMKSSSAYGTVAGIYLGNAEAGTASGTSSVFENLMFDLTNASFPLGAATTAVTPWSGIIAPSRAIDWSQAGVVGGIPNRTTICATLSAGATSAQINSAIASCPAGQVVSLGPGTYGGLSGVDFTGHPNVTLRGAGADQTLLVFTSTTGCNVSTGTLVCIGGTDNNWKGAPSNLADWTSSYQQGTTSITLSSVTNLRVGNLLILDQLDDDANGCDTGGVMVSQSTTTCTGAVPPGVSGPFSLEGNGGGAQRSGRQQAEIKIVTGCNGSTTPGFACSGTNVAVTISPGLYMPNWRASQSPQAWWPTTPITGIGVENLSIDATAVSTGTGIQIKNATNSWVQGVRIIDTNRAHIQLEMATHITSRNNYHFLTQNSGITSYGDECYAGSDYLVENNIYHAVSGPVMVNGACTGFVASYNFAINEYYTRSAGWNETASSVHTAGVAFGLYEGNEWNQVESDVFHGTHHFVTQFRNYEQETQPACYASGSTFATSTYAACNNNLSMRTMAFSRFYNFIGNVLGTTGVQNGYESGSTPIWAIGVGNSNGTVTVPNDPNVGTTLMRWGNYDTFNAAVTFSSAEVPSTLTGVQAPFSNPVPANQSLPPSFYLTAKPSWWPASKPWPAIGPDVTGGNVAGVGGHVYTLPSYDCYAGVMKGLANGSSAVLPFNANACYSTSSATLPAPPTGLKAVVN